MYDIIAVSMPSINLDGNGIHKLFIYFVDLEQVWKTIQHRWKQKGVEKSKTDIATVAAGGKIGNLILLEVMADMI